MYLRQEHAEDGVQVRRGRPRKKKAIFDVGRNNSRKDKRERLNKKEEDEERSETVANAACFHYFCDGVIEDADCSSCCCR
jgi:hypothetical protein